MPDPQPSRSRTVTGQHAGGACPAPTAQWNIHVGNTGHTPSGSALHYRHPVGVGHARPAAIPWPHRHRATRGRGMPRPYRSSGLYPRISSFTFSSRVSASFSVASFFAKWKRIRWFTGSRKKLDPGTAPTPTFAAKSSQKRRSLS